MKSAENFQNWMKENAYDTIRFYPQNVNAYGVTDMIEAANEAVRLYEEGSYTDYQDNIETYIGNNAV